MAGILVGIVLILMSLVGMQQEAHLTKRINELEAELSACRVMRSPYSHVEARR